MQCIRERRVLVRVHYRDVLNGSAMSLAAQTIQQVGTGLRGPLLVLSSGFNLSHPTKGSKIPTQLRLMHELVEALRSEHMEYSIQSDANKHIWLRVSPAV